MSDPPSAIILLPPGASLGGSSRLAVLEMKGIGTAAVLSFVEEVVLLGAGEVESLDGFNHVTIHHDMMVHLRGQRGTRQLRAARPGESMGDTAHHLLTAGSGAADRPAQAGRFQRTWHGAAIFSFLEDDIHMRAATQVIVDVWACGPRFREFSRLSVPTLPGLRPARSHGDPWWGPVSSRWAFSYDPPPCVFYFTFWFGEPDAQGRPFVAAPAIAPIMSGGA